MDTNTLLTIFGIAATVLLGVGAIYLTIRYSQQVGIAYVEHSCLALFDDITQGIEDLQIRFRNSPVSKNIVLVKAYIINTGKRDISPDMVEKPFRVVVPEGFEWIDCKVTSKSKDLQVEIANVATRDIEFKLALFKTHEYFKFDALVTVPPDDEKASDGGTKPPNVRLRDAIGFDYRIADIQTIQRTRLTDLRAGAFSLLRMADAVAGSGSRWVHRLYLWMLNPLWMGIFFILVGILFYFFILFVEPKNIAYEVSGAENETITVNARVKGDQIELYNHHGYRKMVSPKEFSDFPKTTVLAPPDVRVHVVISAVYVSFGVFMLLICLSRFVITHKYRQILRLAES